MLFVSLRRFSIVNPCFLSCFKRACFSIASPSKDNSDNKTDKWVSPSKKDTPASFTNHLRGSYPSSLIWHDQPQLNSHDIEIVDSDTWRLSSGLAHVSKSVDDEPMSRSLGLEVLADDGVVCNAEWRLDDPEIDEIEDMRIQGNLFYKVDPNSKEFEEYSFDLHGRKSSSMNKKNKDIKSKKNSKFDHSTQKDRNSMKMNNRNLNEDDDEVFVNEERLIGTIKEKYIVHNPEDIDSSCVGKKQRSPTFNQLTGPYHEPFCLDIYVSKGSVRACVIHRATSKVVAVAHSISKDMKFDVGSTKSAIAAKAVGKVLAQRALADDIHNVIFTPRKGDRLEGKLQIVLQSIIDNGVDVKVKLKQRNPHKAIQKPSRL